MRDLLNTKRTRRARIVSLITGNRARAADVQAAIDGEVTRGALAAIDEATFGVLGDGAATDSVSITATDATLTSPDNPWTAGDVGKTIHIAGAGAAGGVLVTRIAVFNAAGSVELSDVAVTTVTASKTSAGGLAAWGYDLGLVLSDTPVRSATGEQLQVGMLRGGSRVPRPLIRWSNDTVNVADYGAVGDGIADDTAAWTLAIAAAGANNTIVTPYRLNKIAGVTLTKRVRIVGTGREQCEVAGHWLMTDDAAGSCLEDMNLKDPAGGTLFAITGRGGIDFKRCLFNPGAGKVVFGWDNDGHTPMALECIQCHMNTGKLMDCSAGGVATFSIHIKEVSLFNFTEDDQMVTSAGNYAECLVYQSLVNVSAGLTRFATDLRGLITCRQSMVDDLSTGRVFVSNGPGNQFDTADFADVLIMQTNGATRRFVTLPSLFSGSGIGAAGPVKAAITTGTLNLSGDDQCDYFVIAGNAALAANTTYALSSGVYEGQRKTVLFTGTHTCNGHTLNLLGIAHAGFTQAIGPCRIELIWLSSAWHAHLIGRSGFAGQQIGTQADVADTSGAALAALEASLNSVKAALRGAGIMG